MGFVSIVVMVCVCRYVTRFQHVLWIGGAAIRIVAYRAHASHGRARKTGCKGYTGCKA